MNLADALQWIFCIVIIAGVCVIGLKSHTIFDELDDANRARKAIQEAQERMRNGR